MRERRASEREREGLVVTDDARAPCGQLMEDLSLEARQWQLGKTKLF